MQNNSSQGSAASGKPVSAVMRRALGMIERLLKPRWIRFAVVGGLATFIHASTTILLVEAVGLGSAALANVAGTMAGITMSYLGNHAWTFEIRAGGHARYLPRFLAVYGLIMGSNGALMYLVADLLGIRYLWPLLLTLTVSPFLTFLLNRSFVFQGSVPKN